MDAREAHATIQHIVELLAMTRTLMKHLGDAHRDCATCRAIATEYIVLEEGEHA